VTDQPDKLDLILLEVRRISEVVTGNGTPEKGLVSRVTRTEERITAAAEREKSRLRWTQLAAGAALTAVGTWVSEHFKGH
jgi:hypothetical protein